LGMFFLGFPLLLFAIRMFYAVDHSMQIFVGVVVLWIAKKFFDLAMYAQDDAWYELKFRQTGEDFDERYEKDPYYHDEKAS